VRLKLVASITAGGASALAALWTFPALLSSAFLVAWGAEAAQFLISQGLALALLAWLQTLPEFAVEAVIAWDAGKEPARAHLAIANLTGAIRLLLGFGWPVIYGVFAFASRRTARERFPVITLQREHAVEVLGLLPPLLYFFFIVWKGWFGRVDAVVLIVLYVAYLFVLSRNPPHDAENIADAPRVSRWALRQQGWRRTAAIGGLFGVGGALLFVTAHPFLESIIAMAAIFGISQFFLIQWVAPFLSEFPEMVSTINWARRITRAPMALMNLVSSNINQWTVLAAMIPLVFGYSHWRHFGTWADFPFDNAQRLELVLALLQTALGVMLLASMEFGAVAASGLFALWLIQFLVPESRHYVAIAYAAWMGLLVVLYASRRVPLRAPRYFMETLRGTKSAGPT
jgi:cation:H+ antiporter